jgi:putative alpha-1,2-mannosidase
MTFPSSASTAAMRDGTGLPYSPLILVDLTDLPDSRTNASISVDPATGRISGSGTFSPSFGIGTYDLHFCTDFSGAVIRDTGVFQNNRAGNKAKTVSTRPDGVNDPPLPAGAWTQFRAPTNNQILVRVGVSFMSIAQACHNAKTEIPDFGFEKVLTSAEEAWRKKFSVVEVDSTGVSDELQTTFWSGMYRSMISPQVGSPFYHTYYREAH